MSIKVKSKTEELIDQVEQTFALGQDYCNVEVGRYKWSITTVRALKNRGYRVERMVMGGLYRVYPKPAAPVVEKTYALHLTEGEIIAIRELVRKFPRGSEFAQDYAGEFTSLDNKTTAKLAEICDDNESLKK